MRTINRTINIAVTLYGPFSVTDTIQEALNIRSLRQYFERQIKEVIGDVAKVGTLALTCNVKVEEAIDNDAC